MKVGQRIALIAFSLMMISITVVAALFMCGLFGTEAEAALISEINGSVFYTTCVAAAAVIVCIGCFAIMFLGAGRAQPDSTVIRNTENGCIRVSIDTINSIALRIAKANQTVRDCRVRTHVTEYGLEIHVKVALTNQTIIPQATAELQQSIKNEIESVVGLQVQNVPVLIDNSLVPQQ